MERGPGGVVVMTILVTWRTSAEVAADVRLIQDPRRPHGARMDAICRTTLDELDAHHAAESLLWRARVCSGRGQLHVPAALKTIAAMAAPVAVVLAALLERVGALSDVEVFGRFALAPSDATWIVEGALIAACLAELLRRRLVDRVGGLLRASAAARARCA